MSVLWLLLLFQDPSYDTVRLESREPIDRAVTRDLNGDALTDLLLQAGKDLRVHLQTAGTGFVESPLQTLRLSADTFLWTLASIDGRDLSLLTATSRGLQRHLWNGAGFDPAADLAVHPTLFEGNSSDRIAPLFSPFAPDLDRDGRNEPLLFQTQQIWILRADSTGALRLSQKLPLPSEGRFNESTDPAQPWNFSHALPELAFMDFDGDRRTDLLTLTGEEILASLQREDGSFQAPRTIPLGAERHKEKHRFVRFEVRPQLADFNGDGCLDLAATDATRGRTHLYLSRPGRMEFDTPDRVLKLSDGWIIGLYVLDRNADGRSDLVMAGLRKLDVLTGLQAFISKTIDIDLHFYQSRSDGTMSAEPDQLLTFNIPYTLNATRESANLAVTFAPIFNADVTGDGTCDLLLGQGPNALSVHRSDRRGVLESEAGLNIPHTAPAGVGPPDTTAADLNGDGLSDLILIYRAQGKSKNAVDVLLSKKP